MLFVLAVLLGMAATISAADFLVAAGTKLSVAFEQDVSSKYVKPGDLVPIKLVEPLEIGGQIVLKSGVKGSARVKSVSPAGRAGKAGKVEVELLELTAGEGFSSVDDKNIGLSGNDGPILVEGKGKKTLSWIFILGLFIKGGQGVVPADQPMAALVTDDVIVIVE
jgi:hypothetical protein